MVYLHSDSELAQKYNLPVVKEFHGDKLVDFNALPDDVKKEVGKIAFLRLADSLMAAKGYTRVDKD